VSSTPLKKRTIDYIHRKQSLFRVQNDSQAIHLASRRLTKRHGVPILKYDLGNLKKILTFELRKSVGLICEIYTKFNTILFP